MDLTKLKELAGMGESIRVSADSWGLYDIFGRDTVAAELNAAFNDILDIPTGLCFPHNAFAIEAYKQMMVVLEEYSAFGTMDGESERELVSLIREHIWGKFGERR